MSFCSPLDVMRDDIESSSQKNISIIQRGKENVRLIEIV